MSGHPVELVPPDIAPYRVGNTGIPYFTTFESGRPGPHVLINAVIHGNELCGAIAIDHLFRHEARPLRGRLSLGFSNVEAFLRFDRTAPDASRYVEEDMNRVWDRETLDGPRRSLELDRAREIRPLIDTVDLLLDIHSMQEKSSPLMLAGPLAKGAALARRVGAPSDIVVDAGHVAGARLRDYGAFADPNSSRNALLIECGQHWEAASANLAIDSAWRFLMAAEMIELETAAPHLVSLPQRQRLIEITEAVTVRSAAFRFAAHYTGMEVIPEAGSVIAYDGGEAIRTPYDHCILVMPARRLRPGQTAVRLGRITPNG